MVQWSDSFWGEGNRGLEILSSNIKNGAIAIEEFQRFLTESAQCESTYSKSLSRLQTQFIKIQHVGTFTPIWNLIRDLLDKISSTHLITVNYYQDLLRDIHNYQELYQKKVKVHIQKDSDIIRTADLITQLNNSLNTVNKAKEQYYSIALDYERSKRAGNNNLNPSGTSTSQDSNSGNIAQTALHSLTTRNVERLERKYRQAQDEYKLTIEKYNLIRNDYEKRFSDASTKFQAFEIDHIEKMLVFSLNYSDILQRSNGQIRQAQNEFNDKLKLLTGNDLLDAFVEQKKTGIDRPVLLQFEEIDNLRTSIQLSDLPTVQDDNNLVNQLETGVPSFQAHFSVQTLTAKPSDNNRALGTHSPSNDPTMTPSNLTSTPINSMNSMTRSQDGNNGSEQATNPFDLRIKRPKFPGFFIPNRNKDKDKREKKNDKKPTVNTKITKLPPKQNSRDESNDFTIMTDNNDDYVQISSNNNKNKSPTPEPYTQSSSSISNDEMNHHNNQNRSQFPSSKISKSSSSSDTSDDDDNLMTKIFVKINETKPPVLSDEDDETKISNAMRLVDKNLGNFLINSRGSSNRTPDLNKSISSGQIGTRPLPPPPITSRSILTIQNSITPNNVDHSNMFPPHDEFAQIPFNSINQENFSIPSQSTSESKNTTSISSNDDDTEVANSFPNNDLTNKATPFPILQVPRLSQSNQQSQTNSMSPSIISMHQNFSNSPISSNELGISPLTIGATDQIPLAIAFQETIHVIMSGDNQENWKSRIVGQMLISFPSSMLNLLMDSSRTGNTLEFRLKNFDNIENIIAKPSLITQNKTSTDTDELIYSFDMIELNNNLRNLQEKNPSSLFFNLNVLNYELKQSNLSNIPIEISSQWTRTFDTISVNIKYHFNSSILPESIRFNNNSVIFYTIITDAEQIKESIPTGEWSANEHKLWWKVPYINNGTGHLSAIMITMQTDIDENEQPLTTSSTVKAYFVGENALFSSIDFDLTGRNYRISLLKKKILSGKYQSEPDQNEPIQLFKRLTQTPLSDT